MKLTQRIVGLVYLLAGLGLVIQNITSAHGQFAVIQATGIFFGVALGWLGVKLITEA